MMQQIIHYTINSNGDDIRTNDIYINSSTND